MRKIKLFLLTFLLGGCSLFQHHDLNRVDQEKVGKSSQIPERIELCDVFVGMSLGQPVKASDEVGIEYFDDAAFIGDSRMVSINSMSNLTNASVYAAVSMDLNKVFTKPIIPMADGSLGYLLDALNQYQYGKIYMSFGLNELGWYALDVFEEKYTELIQSVKVSQPNATIYLLDIFNISQDRIGGMSYHTLERIKEVNDLIMKIAVDQGVNVIHMNEMLGGDDQYLPASLSSDGFHLNKDGFASWEHLIRTHVHVAEEVYEKRPCVNE